MEMKIKQHIEPRIAVVGIGGAGCNVINDVYWADGSLYTIAINTDKDSLRQTKADKKVCLCRDVTKGEGAKGDTVLAETCAKAHITDIKEALKGYDTLFIVAGMGGGTGTGVSPVVAAVAHSLGMITFTIAIKPFSFETGRMKVAKEGISRMTAMCPMTIVIENDKIASAAGNVTMDEAFRAANASVIKFIAEKKQKISEAMTREIMNMSTMVEESAPSYLSAYVGTPA
jgi:cell division protein FtsZ